MCNVQCCTTGNGPTEKRANHGPGSVCCAGQECRECRGDVRNIAGKYRRCYVNNYKKTTNVLFRYIPRRIDTYISGFRVFFLAGIWYVPGIFCCRFARCSFYFFRLFFFKIEIINPVSNNAFRHYNSFEHLHYVGLLWRCEGLQPATPLAVSQPGQPLPLHRVSFRRY